jgi:myosin-5
LFWPHEQKEATIRVRPSYILELQQRAVMAEKALREKEEDNILLRQKLQHYDQQWVEYKAKMSSMEEMWQKQMSSLQLSLEVAKKSMASEESTLQTSPKESSVDPRAISAKHSRGARPLLPTDEEEFEWDDEAASASAKSPLQNSSKFSQAGSEYASSHGEVAAGRSYVTQMVREYDHRRQVFTDDVEFLVEVKSGQAQAHLNPEEELRKLKARFDGWKKDFKVRLRETKVVLSKLGNADSIDREKEKTRKKWWSKRLPP